MTLSRGLLDPCVQSSRGQQFQRKPHEITCAENSSPGNSEREEGEREKKKGRRKEKRKESEKRGRGREREKESEGGAAALVSNWSCISRIL